MWQIELKCINVKWRQFSYLEARYRGTELFISTFILLREEDAKSVLMPGHNSTRNVDVETLYDLIDIS